MEQSTNNIDYFFDVVSFDKNGFTIKIIPTPPSNTMVTIVEFEQITWKEYILKICEQKIPER